MIDLKLLRASPAQVRAALARRGDPSLIRLLDEIEALDMKRRTLTAQLDTLKAERNDAAKTDAQIAKAKGKLPEEIVAARRKLGDRITGLESEFPRSRRHWKPRRCSYRIRRSPTCRRSRPSCAAGGRRRSKVASRIGRSRNGSASSICRAAPSSRARASPS